MEASFKALAQRAVNADNSFIESVKEQFGKTREEAETILRVFEKVKAIKIDPVVGQYKLTSGVFWDAQVMDNALNNKHMI